MIIKKKYTTIKRVIDEVPKEETLPVEEDVVNTYEDIQPPLQIEQQEPISDIEPNPEIKEEQEQEQNRDEDIDDLDLSLQNIRFEQREERREGTRRRGYRRSQDRNIITRAQQEAITIKESAKEEGYNEGIKNAEKDLKEIKNKLEKFFDCKEEVYEKVSGCMLIEDINKTENKITLKVKPKDVEIVKDNTSDIFSGQYFEAKISVVPDNSIKDGGVIIETSNGIVDASIDTQIAIIEQALKKPEANT